MNDGNPIKSVIAVLALSATLLAPGAQAGDERREEHRERMQAELGLSDEQMQQMKEIRESGGSREDAAAVLTEEQREKMRELREQHPDRARMQEHRARMQVELGVTDEQMQQMHEIRRNGGSREDAAAVLTEEQRAQMRQWREENPEKAHKMNKHRDHHGSSAEQ